MPQRTGRAGRRSPAAPEPAGRNRRFAIHRSRTSRLHTFEIVLLLLLGAILLTGLARRIGAPYPSLLACGGAALAFLPWAPKLQLAPDLALALFVAPILVDAAFDASPRDLKKYAVPVAGLVIACVGLTTAAVAVVVHAMVPHLGWAPAIALGAMVAPPDAAAAQAVLRQVRPAHKIMVILEGESLLNDASSLLIYRVAVASVGAASIQGMLPNLALQLVGSVAFGFVAAHVWMRLIRRFEDMSSIILLEFVSTFGVWLLAERLELSAILTIVVYAMTLGQATPARTPARMRLQAYAVWDTVVFLLNVMAFTLVGLQLKPILESENATERYHDLVVAAAVLATAIAARLVWVIFHNLTVRASRRLIQGDESTQPSLAGSVVIGWSGMRGLVTLAAALALPADFPERDLLQLCAFTVALGTLIIQGLTLKPLLRFLDLRDGDPVGREIGMARVRVHKAAVLALDGDRSPEAERVRSDHAVALDHAKGRPSQLDPERLDQLRMAALAAGRQCLLELRDQDAIGDDAFHAIEAELDVEEVTIGAARSADAA